jgi:hypothetical protein
VIEMGMVMIVRDRVMKRMDLVTIGRDLAMIERGF